MSPSEHQPPGPSHPGGDGDLRLITRDILEAYLNCKYKGYLKLIGQIGTPLGYEVLMKEVRQELRQRAYEGLVRRSRGEEILKGPAITPSVLGTGPPLILDAVIENGEFSLVFDGLNEWTPPHAGRTRIMSRSWSSRGRRSARSTARSWKSMPWSSVGSRVRSRSSG